MYRDRLKSPLKPYFQLDVFCDAIPTLFWCTAHLTREIREQDTDYGDDVLSPQVEIEGVCRRNLCTIVDSASCLGIGPAGGGSLNY